jgi:hypothetical protein
MAVEFYSTAAQVIPTLLIVAALESRLLSWAAQLYRQNGWKKRMGGRVLTFSIGVSLVCEAIALVVLLVDKQGLTTCWLIRAIVLVGCLFALLAAWAGGHRNWMDIRDSARQATDGAPVQEPPVSRRGKGPAPSHRH